METLVDYELLKFRPETLEAVRKDINLDARRITEAVDILESWVQMQHHFVKKDFSRDYLERTLVTAKGLVERAKERLDKLCTFKTLMPEYFTVSDVKKEFSSLAEILSTAHMPKLTPEHYRVYVSKVVSDKQLDSSILFTFYRYLTMLSECVKRVEYCAGFVVILDYSDMNVMNFMTKISPVEFRQIVTIMTEGYGLRIKGIHVITDSKMVDTLVTLLKQVFSSKLGNRIQIHKNKESVHKFVPKELLPSDFGGHEKPLKDIHSDWINAMSSSEFQKYFKVMNEAKTNESYRQKDKFNENYVGMPGSFRSLSVD